MPTEQQLRQAEDQDCVYVLCSRPFLKHLTSHWSEPVQIKVEKREGDVIEFVARVVGVEQ